MRARALIAAAAAAFSLSAVAPAGAAESAGGLASDNVTWLKNIPEHFDSSGARLYDGYFYITTGRDLAIYDVSTPEDPQQVGKVTLPVPADRFRRRISTPTAASRSWRTRARCG